MARDASDLAQRLGRNAEAVCREYLSNGRRVGHYWLVGNIWRMGQMQVTNYIHPPQVKAYRPAAERRIKQAGRGKSSGGGERGVVAGARAQ